MSGNVFVSVRNDDKEAVVAPARMLAEMGFELLATSGTQQMLARHGVACTRIAKMTEGRPNIVDFIKNGQIHLIINTPTKKGPQTDEGRIRAMAVINRVPMITTITGASAAARAIRSLKQRPWTVRPLQTYFGK